MKKSRTKLVRLCTISNDDEKQTNMEAEICKARVEQGGPSSSKKGHKFGRGAHMAGRLADECNKFGLLRKTIVRILSMNWMELHILSQKKKSWEVRLSFQIISY